ncbi:MAG: thiol oxidoreductase [Desulfobacter sp.]|nr:MAG: thiol oxidoreductase [Desulfobacter sp.]
MKHIWNMIPKKKTAALGLALLTAVLGSAPPLYAHRAIGGIPTGLSEEYFSGGRNGTVFSTTSRCFELPAPAIAADERLSEQFAQGEAIFEADYVTDRKAPYGGLGPIYNNNSCRNCHPNYARGRQVKNWNEQFGNSYLAFVHTPEGKFVKGVKFMFQTMATPPYKPLAQSVELKWHKYVDEHGNKYPDGSPYNKGSEYEGTLVYPTARIVDPLIELPKGHKVSLEGTIGIIGTGLLDAVKDEDIIAEYKRQQALEGPVKGQHGRWITEPYDGKKHLGKFTTHNARATLMNGPGFNGSWSVPNITREDRPKLFATQEWIDKQDEMGLDTDLLTAHQPAEMSRDDLDNLMVWSRGLAVPAARDLDKPIVKRGREMFYEANCQQCHKPSWTTGKYDYIPGYENQKIWPYTDLLMHDMGRINDGLKKTYRTPPLWGRGLMRNVVDHSDMMHDLRARNFEEAILWHFGEGKDSREAFRKMSAKDRKALIEFCKSI